MSSIVPLPETTDLRATGGLSFSLADMRRTIWLTREDIRAFLDDNPRSFDGWLLTRGIHEYRALDDLALSVDPDALRAPAPDVPGAGQADDGLPITRFMAMIWGSRPDLKETFPLGTPKGQRDFLRWYFVSGVVEHSLARFVTPEQKRALTQPDARAPAAGLLPFTRLMGLAWDHRPDLRESFDITTPDGKNGFLMWFFVHGMVELQALALMDDDHLRLLASPHPRFPGLSRIVALLWRADPALQARFPDPRNPALAAWGRSPEACAQYPVLRGLSKAPAAEDPAPLSAPAVQSGPPGDPPFGLNLVGYAKGQFGIGEDVRMAARACQAAAIPFSIYNVEPGTEVCQGDDSVVSHVSEALPHAVTLLCTTGFETARLAAQKGRGLFDGRPCIGYWPWELSDWPTDWRHAYGFVDEVWASSRFTFESYARSCPKPLRHMPMAVTVEATRGLSRADFDLPETRFLFVFSFDFLSALARKNPQGCVTAFRRAFPRGDEPVGLVIKAMRATPDTLLWQEILAEAEADGRITIIPETLPRADLLDLYRACDCFVSLHRSEGFGRGLVEAMMLGKPVIATGYSGNLDFTTPGTAALVDYRLRPVAEGDYPFAEGLTWADPDLDHAAWWMRRLVAEPQTRARLADTGQRLATTTYAPATVGATYAAVLGGGVFSGDRP